MRLKPDELLRFYTLHREIPPAGDGLRLTAGGQFLDTVEKVFIGHGITFSPLSGDKGENFLCKSYNDAACDGEDAVGT